MKAMRLNSRITWTAATIGAVALAPLGCGGGFLNLQDYARDLLFPGALAAGLLLGDNGTGTGTDGNGTGQPVPDIEGPAGPAGEQGPQGEPGADGADGMDGADGADGADGPAGPQGAEGPEGPQGPDGPEGPAGPDGASGPAGPAGANGANLFTIFVDDFFATDQTIDGSLPVQTVSVTEPALGYEDGKGGSDALAYRVAIPQVYNAGNDVTMRLFFDVTGPLDECFVFQLDAMRLVDGGSVMAYGSTRWVRPDAAMAIAGEGAERLELVVDLPLNTAAGLGFPDDLAARDFLAFELATEIGCAEPGFDCPLYHLVAVEFFESADGTATLSGAAVFDSNDADLCPDPCEGTGVDCNENGRNDLCELEEQTAFDCNQNGTLDECDIADGTSTDENMNGEPDECEVE